MGVHEGDWERVSVLVCAEDLQIQQVRPTFVHYSFVAWLDKRLHNSLLGGSARRAACLLPAEEGHGHHVASSRSLHASLLLLTPAQPGHHCCCLQVSYSQHGWWETRDCTQGMCTLAPDPDGTNSSILHPGQRAAEAQVLAH